MQDQLLTIQEVSDRLKVPKHTLRFWEKELDGIIVPHRTNGGQRRYGLKAIAIIEEIKRLRKRGMSLAEIKRKLGDSNNSNSDRIDLLADKITEVVKAEVYRFLEGEAE
ncbi:MAG: MerR family transcriptional regulator [Desulfobacterales bacterium]|nr:MerR family transcriptional regulator [Desulfobacterales bacterium]